MCEKPVIITKGTLPKSACTVQTSSETALRKPERRPAACASVRSLAYQAGSGQEADEWQQARGPGSVDGSDRLTPGRLQLRGTGNQLPKAKKTAPRRRRQEGGWTDNLTVRRSV